MHFILLVILEGILGYLLQATAFIIGMHGVAGLKMDKRKVILVSLICAVFALIVRLSGLFNFGVHTMLVLLACNACCITICKMDTRKSILGSILMMLLVLAGELVNVGILKIIRPMDDIQTLLNSSDIVKAASAIPGNIVHLVVSFLIYNSRVLRKKGGSNE